MATFIFLHGSFHAAWNWHRVIPLLRSVGLRGIALDLPAHGRDRRGPRAASLRANVRQVVACLDATRGPVVLVAHSRNGTVLSQVAELRPERLTGLVYLAAYLVPHGKSMMDYALGDTRSLVVQNVFPRLSPRLLRAITRIARTRLGRWWLSWSWPRGMQVHRLSPAAYREALYHDCGEEITELAHSLLEPEPNWAGFTPLRLSAERYGRVPKVYIECTEDRAVTLDLQRAMQRDTPCDAVFSLDSGHSPFFSQPQRLVDVLVQSLSVFERHGGREFESAARSAAPALADLHCAP